MPGQEFIGTTTDRAVINWEGEKEEEEVTHKNKPGTFREKKSPETKRTNGKLGGIGGHVFYRGFWDLNVGWLDGSSRGILCIFDMCLLPYIFRSFMAGIKKKAFADFELLIGANCKEILRCDAKARP